MNAQLADAVTASVAKAIAQVQRDAERAEELRAAEHRAFMAEQREKQAGVLREIEKRLAELQDGEQGERGEKGDRGEKGEQGERGFPGERGEKGDKGDPGEKGERGADGERGEIGLQGEQGRQGDPGPRGETGERGEKGETGERGLTGEKGEDAYPGSARGLYCLTETYRALDCVSFNGSEWRAKVDNPGELPGPDWMLSASKGKRGERGERGERGLEGKAGIDGQNGASIAGARLDAEQMVLEFVMDDGSTFNVDLMAFAEALVTRLQG